jgi:hypothetical protein
MVCQVSGVKCHGRGELIGTHRNSGECKITKGGKWKVAGKR